MTSQPLQTLNSVCSFRYSISLFSSIEGVFSRDIGDGTRTLHDLITLLRPLGLDLYRGIEMHGVSWVGEGGSYRVYRCYHSREQLVAAKVIKLPLDSTAKEKDVFRRRVVCLIKDLEVMHHPPMARHENILGLLGYGWNMSGDSALPFLVTEYAEQGTLREFLQKETISIALKLKLCGDIASGLHAMHLCGVSHGDLKLENVLVFQGEHGYRSVADQYSAKLCDFGHSCVSSSAQAQGSAQSYRGTIGYIPPELYQDEPAEVDFPKCDIWALALLLWETLAGGSRYFEDCKVDSLLQQETSKSLQTKETMPKDDGSGKGTKIRPGYNFFLISEHLCPLAVDFAEVELRQKISPLSRALVEQIFRMSLQKDPIKRCGDVSKLPFTSSKHSSAQSGYVDTAPVEPAGVQTRWSFEGFSPQNLRASKLPHMTKAQMLADVQAIATSEPGERAASAALYVGYAYAVGFGITQNMEVAYSWISKSAAHGSPAASLILEVLENPETQQQKIMRALKRSVEGRAYSSGPGACRFVHDFFEVSDLSSFSSADGCNPLHYLSLFQKLTNPKSYLRSKGLDVLKRKLNWQELPQSHLDRDDYDIGKGFDLSAQVLRLCEIVRYLGPQFSQATTANIHYLHEHFPMILSGPPISFAITLDCREAVSALLYETQNFDTFSVAEASGLEAAVSCHRSHMFRLIWSTLLARGHADDLFDLVFGLPPKLRLIAALATRSSLERTVLHRQNRSLAQTKIIKILLGSLWDLVTYRFRSFRDLRTTASLAYTRLVGEEIEEILKFGDLDIAVEVRRLMLSRVVTTPRDKVHRQRIFKAAMHMACSGYFDLDRSKQFVDFSQDCGQDLNPAFQALATMIEYKAEALFQSCMKDQKVDGCDEDGQSLLHLMILSGFCAFVPLSLAISHGADPNYQNREGQTPLHLAVCREKPQIVEDLLANGAEPFLTDDSDASVLIYAVTSRNISIIANIVETLEAKVRESLSVTSLGQALQTKHPLLSQQAYRCVVEHGTIDGCHTRRGTTALQIAAKNRDIETVRLLLSYGADADATDSDGNTALHYAVYPIQDRVSVAVSCCHLLLQAKPKDLSRNKEGETPLHLLAQTDEGDLKDFLTCFVRHHGCDVNVQNTRGETILHQAASRISVASVTTILSFGAAINQKDHRGRTAAHVFAHAACFVTRPSSRRDQRIERMMETLIDAGADPLLRDYSQGGGYTAMEYAVLNGNNGLFSRICEMTSRRLLISRTFQTPHNLESPEISEQWLSSAWSLSVAEEQWPMVKNLLLHHPGFEADLSLLMWPKGAHLLKYATAVCDEDLLLRFSASFVPPGEVSKATFNAQHPPPYSLDSSSTSNLHSYSSILKDLSQYYLGSTERRTDDRWLSATTDPEWLKLSYVSQPWSSEQLRSWESWVKRVNIHRGGDPLNEIFEFMTTLDQWNLAQYFGNVDRKRVLANEYAFRWEDEVSARTLGYASWVFQCAERFPTRKSTSRPFRRRRKQDF